MATNEPVRLLRRSFRHLKRGVFPPEAVDEFTFGRRSELLRMEHHLEDVDAGGSRRLFVEGAYGRGKSHLLKAIESLCLRRHFAVSWVTLDGYSHAFNHPTRYLHALLENIRISELPVRGMVSVVRHWLGNQRRDGVLSWARRTGSSLAHAVLGYEACSPVEVGGNWYLNMVLEGRDLQHRSGRTWFSTAVDRLDQVGALCRAAGLSGVVYLFDELETVATLLTTARQRFLCYELLNLLSDGRKHPYCCFVFAATPDFGLRVNEDRSHHHWYNADYPDGCRFTEKWGESDDRVELSRLTKGDLLSLCVRLCALHGTAFSWDVDSRFCGRFLDGFLAEVERLGLSIREMLKAIVYLLEIAHQNPGLDVEAALALGDGRENIEA